MVISFRKVLIVLYLLLVGTGCLYSQVGFEKEVDSLLIAAKNDTTHITYENLGNLVARASEKDGQNIFDYAINQDSTVFSRFFLYDGLSRNLSRGGRVDDALQYRYNQLKLTQKEALEELQLRTHISIANAYNFKNQLDSATYHLNIAQALAERDNKNWLWNIYYNRALVQSSMGNNNEAAYYYKLMWDDIQDSSKPQQIGFTLWIVTYFFTQSGQFPEDQAKFLNLLAEHYDKQEVNVPPGHVDVHTLFDEEIVVSNREKYENLVAISDSLNQINSYYHNTKALSEILAKEGKYKQAIAYLKKVEEKLKTLDKPSYLLAAYQQMGIHYETTKDYKNALKVQKQEYQLRDSVITEQVRRNVSELEVKFETEKKEREIVEQQLEIAQKDRQQFQILVALGVLGILLIFSLLFFRYRLKNQKIIATQQEAIQQQEIIDLKQRNKLLALNSMIEGQESERLRIAQDLHDSLGGLLSTVKAHFSIIQKEIQHLESLNITTKTNQLIDEACVEVRRISHNMIPQSLTISGLQGAIEDMVEQLKIEGYEVVLETDNVQKSEDTTRDVTIYRLVQEIISNMRKHAKAKNVFLQLVQSKTGMSIILEDDGVGFNYKEALSKGGLGLKSINSRVSYLDGTIDWDSRSGEGTSINITIPQQ